MKCALAGDLPAAAGTVVCGGEQASVRRAMDCGGRACLVVVALVAALTLSSLRCAALCSALLLAPAALCCRHAHSPRRPLSCCPPSPLPLSLPSRMPSPSPPVRSLFHRLEARAFADLTSADDLRVGLVALLDATTHCRGASRGSQAADSQRHAAASSTAAIAAASVPAVAASSGADGSLSAAASSHLFALLSRYPQPANRIARYMELDSSALWLAVRRQSRFALHSSEAVRTETSTRRCSSTLCNWRPHSRPMLCALCSGAFGARFHLV